MFCPDCGANNPEQTRFCRGCGRNMAAVALAVNEQTVFSHANGLVSPPKTLDESLVELTRDWLRSQRDGIQEIVQGTIAAGAGILLGFPLYWFSPQADWHTNWILIWLIFCGWLPVLGAVRTGTGVTKLIYSRTIRRSLDKFIAKVSGPTVTNAGDTKKIGAAPPASITEDTTAHLISRSRD
jgi:hypothetical protein